MSPIRTVYHIFFLAIACLSLAGLAQAADTPPRYKLIPEQGGWWSSTVPDLTSAGTITGTTVAMTGLTSCSVLQTDSAGNTSCNASLAGGLGDITDVTAGNGLTGGASSGAATLDVGEGLAIDAAADSVAFDPTELTGSRTFGDASTDTIVWTWDRATGTDPTLTMGSGTVTGQIVAASVGLTVGTETITDLTGAGLVNHGGSLDVTLSGDVGVASDGTATIQANSVALTTDTTGSYAAGDAEAGNALTGDSATAFFSAGQIEAARGGTGMDSSGSTGVPRVSAGTWTINAGISHLAASTSADLSGVLSDEQGSGAAVFATSPTLTTPVIGVATGTSLAVTGFLTAQNASGDKIGIHSEDGSVYLRNSTTPMNLIGNPEASTKLILGDSTTTQFQFPSNGTGNNIVILPSNSVGVSELDFSNTGTTGQVATLAANGQLTWATASGSFTSFTLSGDSGSDQTITDGNTLEVAGGSGITTSGAATDTVNIVWDPTEVSSTTFGAGSFTTLTFDAGTCDPRLTSGNKILTMGCVNGTNNESMTLDFDTTANTIDLSSSTGVTDLTSAFDLNITKANANITLTHTGGDTFHIGTEANSNFAISNATDGVQYFQANTLHQLTLGSASTPWIALETSTTGDSAARLPTNSIGVSELDAIDSPTNGEILSYNVAYRRMEWVADQGGVGGSGDVTDVGDCATGACFTGSSGTSLTPSGGTLSVIGDLTVTDATAAVLWDDTSGDDFECWVDDSQWYCGNFTDATQVIRINQSNQFGLPNLGACPNGVILDGNGNFVCGAAPKEFWWPGAATFALEASEIWPPIAKDAGTNLDLFAADFDASLDECRTVVFQVPAAVVTTSQATFSVWWYSAAATTGNAIWYFRNNGGVAQGVDPDQSLTNISSIASATQGTAGQVTQTTWQVTPSAMNWVAGDLVVGQFCRDGNAQGDTLAGDARALGFGISVPQQ